MMIVIIVIDVIMIITIFLTTLILILLGSSPPSPWFCCRYGVVSQEVQATSRRNWHCLPGHFDQHDLRWRGWCWLWWPQELGTCWKQSELYACPPLAWASSTGVFLVQCTVDDHESVITMIPSRKKYLVQAKLEIHTRLRALNWTRWHQLWFDFLGGIRIPLQKLLCA